MPGVTGASFVYRVYKTGARMEPRGAPADEYTTRQVICAILAKLWATGHAPQLS